MQDRVAGYRQAIEEAGMPERVSECRIKESALHEGIGAAVERLLGEGVDSFLFATNNIAVETLMVVKGLNLRIPGDLGIIGFDGGSAFELFHVPVSYIRQPIALMAQKAMEILMDQLIHGDSMIQCVEVQGTFVRTPSSERAK